MVQNKEKIENYIERDKIKILKNILLGFAPDATVSLAFGGGFCAVVTRAFGCVAAASLPVGAPVLGPARSSCVSTGRCNLYLAQPLQLCLFQ